MNDIISIETYRENIRKEILNELDAYEKLNKEFEKYSDECDRKIANGEELTYEEAKKVVDGMVILSKSLISINEKSRKINGRNSIETPEIIKMIGEC